MAVYGPVRHKKNIWTEAVPWTICYFFGPYYIFLVTDRSIYCHMTLSAMKYLLFIIQVTFKPVLDISVTYVNICPVATAILICLCMLGKGPSNDHSYTLLGYVSVISYLRSAQNMYLKTTHRLIIQVKLF